jgi:hypothetical protein
MWNPRYTSISIVLIGGALIILGVILASHP